MKDHQEMSFARRKEDIEESIWQLYSGSKNMVTTAARSRDYMRKLGWTAQVVELRHGSFVRKDLFDVGDTLAFHPQHGILLIQAYQKNAIARHIGLNSGHPVIRKWLESGGLFEHHIWSKQGKRGKRKTWKVTRECVSLAQ